MAVNHHGHLPDRTVIHVKDELCGREVVQVSPEPPGGLWPKSPSTQQRSGDSYRGAGRSRESTRKGMEFAKRRWERQLSVSEAAGLQRGAVSGQSVHMIVNGLLPLHGFNGMSRSRAQ